MYATTLPETIDLSGTWELRLDPKDVGISESWQEMDYTDKINLPGSLQAQGFGERPAMDSNWTGQLTQLAESKHEKVKRYLDEKENFKMPNWLQPERIYVGAAWYQKEIEIPESWKGKRAVLHLERPHWETRVWVDDTYISSHDGLGVPHEHDLTQALSPGRHRLTIRVDNRMIVDVGHNAHSVSDHTQSNWNGMVGALELRATEPVWLDDIQIFPDAAKKSASVRVKMGNTSGASGSGMLRWSVLFNGEPVREGEQPITWDKAGAETGFEIQLGPDARLWDEFHPNLYQLQVRLEPAGEQKQVTFGLRDFGTEGTQFTINGRKLILRGTLECAIFPLTGYPPTDVESWRRIFRICRDHGLNHMRFHSWCPPRAAFIAADEEGFYLQPEVSAWGAVGKGQPLDKWLYEEAHRMTKAYGNHPSFALMAHGNEPGGINRDQFLDQWCGYWKKENPRALHTSGAGWPVVPQSDYHSVVRSVGGAPCRIQMWGQGLNSVINGGAPRTNFDWSPFMATMKDKPSISHEIGQWCVYPNFEEMKKYTGVLKPRNFEIFKEILAENHMGDQAHDFLMASGKLQVMAYKSDIEAALRTPGFGGFQLLDLHDFPGQGTALVGVLDPFWDAKPYVSAEEYRRFSGSTVPLARMAKRILMSSESLQADIEIAHFGSEPLKQAQPVWKITGVSGKVLGSGKLDRCDIPVDNGTVLGKVDFDCSQLPVPARYKLVVGIEGSAIENDWDFWVYPPSVTMKEEGILVVDQLTPEARETLQKGGKVLWLAHRKRTTGDVQIGFSPAFWNTLWTEGQAPHTLGMLCKPDHPVFRDFPTDYHSDWQWWELIHSSYAMILDDLPATLRPLVQPIDTWFEARRLGLLFEARVDGGKLMVCSMDIESDLKNRHAARQFRKSLMDYLSSPGFHPSGELSLEQVMKVVGVNRE
jgi:hypothetical protein